MFTREELLIKIGSRKALLKALIDKYNEFNNYMNNNDIDTLRIQYENTYDHLVSINSTMQPLITICVSDMQTLKNKIAYYDNLLKVQYNGDLDHGIASLIEMFNNNKNAHIKILRLYTILYSLTIKIIEYASKSKVLINAVYNKSYDSSLQGSIIRQQSDVLDAAAANSQDLKDYLETLKKSSKNVYKGGKTRKRLNKR